MDPHMNHSDGEKRVEAGDETFPANNQATVLPLEPGKGSLSLKAWDVLLRGRPRGFLVFQTRFGICGRIPRLRRR
jgi:hypothetical protein